MPVGVRAQMPAMVTRDPSLSPRQQFQSHIRHFDTCKSTAARHDATAAPPNLSPHLQRVSSLRVRTRTPYSIIPRAAEQRASPRDAFKTVTGYEHLQNADFGSEESAVWARTPPQESAAQETEEEESIPLAAPVLAPPLQEQCAIPQPRKRSSARQALNPFGPQGSAVDVTRRPQTRHSTRTRMSGWPLTSTEQDDNEVVDKTAVDDYGHRVEASKRSKFLEGSMNERSIAVASSWHEADTVSEFDTDTEEDTEVTPRPAKTKTSHDDQKVSSEAETPAVSKRRFFGLRKTTQSADDDTKQKADSPKKPRRGLRKSLSIWNFHSSEANSQVSLQPTEHITPKPKPISKTLSPAKNEKNILDERKRKAEEAYSKQFSVKKLRSNAVLTKSTSAVSLDLLTPAEKAKAKKRRSFSGGDAVPLIRDSASHDRKPSRQNAVVVHEDRENSDVDKNSIDYRKRPSRRDLEKENQQLRDLLRQSQSDTFAKSVSVQVAQELMRHTDDVVSVSSEAWTQIPRTNPLPKAANGTGRQTLGELGNGRAGDRHSSRQSIQRRRSAVNGRVVPTIMEEDDEHSSKFSGAYGRGDELTEASKEPWNWPEDVF